MKKRIVILSVAMIALLAVPAPAQTSKEQPKMTPEQQAEMEIYMKAGTPGPPHQRMAASAGDWDVQVKSWEQPGAPPVEEKGTVKRSMILGGRVMVEEFSGSMMGMPFTGYGLNGYDNVTGKYWATWNDSMSTGIMVSDGTCDAQGANCTFTGSWNDPVKKAPVKARMILKRVNPTTETFEMYAPGKDGKEMKMMEMTYSKK